MTTPPTHFAINAPFFVAETGNRDNLVSLHTGDLVQILERLEPDPPLAMYRCQAAGGEIVLDAHFSPVTPIFAKDLWLNPTTVVHHGMTRVDLEDNVVP